MMASVFVWVVVASRTANFRELELWRSKETHIALHGISGRWGYLGGDWVHLCGKEEAGLKNKKRGKYHSPLNTPVLPRTALRGLTSCAITQAKRRFIGSF
jgi:hypothetical protein